ncbi:MAG TPA: SRPBCC family protein [Steroidobacteraceae bacterium]|nr:SRPBCC family protein [Steroidobacteraceae bacterium]
MTVATHHGQFTLERTYRATPERVYAAWSEVGAKAHWFIGPEGWRELRREMDFRVGGHELLEGRYGSERVTRYTARFHALEAARRIVFVYDMHLSDVHHSTSLATVELAATANGTRLRFTEQVAFLDGTTSADSRAHGTGAHLDRLALYLARDTF